MKAIALEFETHLNEDGTISLPPEIASQLKGVESVRVLLILPASSEDKEWADLTKDQFLQGYADGDAIYDQLSGR